MEATKCINCGSDTTSRFCADCGQRTDVKRITLREGWNDFWARVYGFDGMFPNTLRDLTTRPGKASQLFIDGNRIKYYGPVGYFFLMITLIYLVGSIVDVSMIDLMKSTGGSANLNSPKVGSGQEKFMETMLIFISENLKSITFLYIPVQALASRYLFFRKSSLNYFEHMVLPFYSHGHTAWISIISILLFGLFGFFLPPILYLMLPILYVGYAYADMFVYQSKIKAFLKGIGVYFTAQLLVILMAFIVLTLLIILDPTIFDMLKPSTN